MNIAPAHLDALEALGYTEPKLGFFTSSRLIPDTSGPASF